MNNVLLGTPDQLSMGDGYDYDNGGLELPSGSCGDQCKSCFCPCCVFGKVVGLMHGDTRGVMDKMACGTWAAFVLCLWGGTALGAQLLAAQVGSGAAQYSVYALYLLYYLEYMFPYLQAMNMYRSLKAIHTAAGGGDPQPGHASSEVRVSAGQWCSFLVCPCLYLGRVATYVDVMNGANSGAAAVLHLEQQTLCPFECHSDYVVEVVPRGGQAAAAAAIPELPMPGVQELQQQQQQQQQQAYYGQSAYGQPYYGQPAYGQPAYGQPAYGQWGQPQWGQPPWGYPPR